MVQRDLDQQPLRERLTALERLIRELSEHIEQGFLPRVHDLRRVTRYRKSGSRSDITDKTVRDQVERVLDSEKFTSDLYGQLEDYLKSIARGQRDMVGS